MTAKTILLKLLKIAGWTFAAALGSILVIVVLFLVFTSTFWYEITSDLAEEQIVNLNETLSADEVCIFEVGVSGILEIKRRLPEYIKTRGSDMWHEPMAYWSVAAIHHQEKTFDVYVVDRGVVHHAEAGSYCSDTLILRIERSRGDTDFWFAFRQQEQQGRADH